MAPTPKGKPVKKAAPEKKDSAGDGKGEPVRLNLYDGNALKHALDEVARDVSCCPPPPCLLLRVRVFN